MQKALTFFPETGTIEMLIEESMPWFMAWCFVLTIVLLAFITCELVSRLRRRSPVEKLLRKRFG